MIAAGLLLLWAVTPLPVDGLVQHPEHLFDLAHTSVTFRSGQPVRVRRGVALHARGNSADVGRLTLPFAFPIGGRLWREVYLNLNGCLTFGAPDGGFPYLDTWPDGTMRNRAARAELAAASGASFMVAPFWGIFAKEGARLWLKSSAREVVITWEVARYMNPYQGYAPLGRNVFQARLHASGEVEFRYGDVAERDGIVGVFSGLPAREIPLAEGVFDAGSLLHFTAPAGKRVLVAGEGAGTLLRPEPEGAVGLIIEGSEAHATDPMLPALSRTDGPTVHYYLPKLALPGTGRFRWKREDESSLSDVAIARAWRSGADLSSGRERMSGSTYEVFHYAALWKSRHATFRAIDKRRRIDAELAIAFTDFRIDDLHNHGASNAELGANRAWLSTRLLSAAGPVFLGPRFAETITTPERTYRNHAFGVGWMAHEMLHLWGVSTRHTPAIAGPDHHWLDLFETKVVAPVAPLFSDPPYREASIMGGMAVFPTADGRMEGDNSRGAASGLSALDLWNMGLIEANEVPAGHEETRLVTGNNDSVTVRFRDVVTANARVAPPPRGFRQAVYLLHENGRAPRAEALALAASLERMLLRYYDAASQGRMRVKLAE